ncbi:unnamed protein product [Paramecium sonneborni]|uniref:Uncharacterized protein n=1 Tax=Paramecium sonneborni TaxID=65129 RepID=A0A8S1QQ23_9CILI|nr:unnamed protein product [Paramecium sonneborni]
MINRKFKKSKGKQILITRTRSNLLLDSKELTFMNKFNQILSQQPNLQTTLQKFNLPFSTQDNFQAIQVVYLFKRQIQILQHTYQLQLKKRNWRRFQIRKNKKS